MNDPRFDSHDESPPTAPQPPLGEDLLPPVEPPSAGFIIQLFVVPALIVIVIVSVWLSFHWLVRRTATRPQDLIQGLEHGPSIARWQRASELADLLRNPRFADFKQSGEDAARLARILDREIDNASPPGGMQDGEITLRYFLTRALGEFEVQEGTGVLLKAAETQRHPSEQLVRHGALEAIAVRAYQLQQLEPPQQLEHPELEPTLFRLAADDEPQIRSQTAYALGQLGTTTAIEWLEAMADDPDPDTRYNAAVGLAHQGNTRSIETLAEMLDLDELARARPDLTEPNRAFSQALIVHTALEASQALARQNPAADLSPVIDELEQLAAADAAALAQAQLPSRVTFEARRALEVLRGAADEGAL